MLFFKRNRKIINKGLVGRLYVLANENGTDVLNSLARKSDISRYSIDKLLNTGKTNLTDDEIINLTITTVIMCDELGMQKTNSWKLVFLPIV